MVAERVTGARSTAFGAPGDVGESDASRTSVQESGSEVRSPLKPLTSHASEQTSAPSSVREVVSSPGRSLDSTTRRSMESRIGYDFGRIRVHTDARAATSAQRAGASAYAFGGHIVFANNRYTPETREGRRLLAHELTHVVQQSAAAGPSIQRDKDPKTVPADAFKQAGIDSPRHYLDKDSPQLLAAVVGQSKRLQGHLKRAPEVLTKKFKQHGTDDEFVTAYTTINKITQVGKGSKFEDIRGFFDPKSDTIHLRPRSNYGDALHEAMHKLSDVRFRVVFGHEPLDEGVTQYFTNRVLDEQGLPEGKTKYDLSCANKLFEIEGFDSVAKMYFEGDNAARNALQAKLGITGQDFEEYRGKSEKWCGKFDEYLKAQKQKQQKQPQKK